MIDLVELYNGHSNSPMRGQRDSIGTVELPNLTRVDLAKMFGQLGFEKGVEVGTQKGEYAEVLCDNNPGLTLWCVDPWEDYEGYAIGSQSLSYEQAAERLSDKAHLLRAYSPDIASAFGDETLDFVYIDGNHGFAPVVADLYAWLPKIRRGGIMSGHDWHRDKDIENSMQVVEAVYGFTWAYRIGPVYVLGTKHEPDRDKFRSWFWINT